MRAFFEALFHGVEKGFSKEVGKKKKYLAVTVQEEGDQTHLLNAIDDFCRKSKPDVVNEVALVLKSLYDGDVLEEEYIVKWYEAGLKGANKNSQIWKNTKPFIEWLQSAESESE
ncbi:Eukaryotic translation initiation factor 5A-1 [Ranunculus cassubicifolius]